MTLVDDTLIIGTNGKGILKVVPNRSWRVINVGAVADTILSLLHTNGILLAGTPSQGLFRSINNGEQWQALSGEIGSSMIFGFTTMGTALFAATNVGIFSSQDKGISWVHSDTGLSGIWIKTLYSIGPYVYAGTFDNGVFRSDDTGKTWFQTGSELSSYTVSSFTGNTSDLYVATNYGGVYTSSDMGAHWSDLGLKDQIIPQIVVTDSGLYATTDVGLSFLQKGASKWVNITFRDSVGTALLIRDSLLYLGQRGKGLSEYNLRSNKRRMLDPKLRGYSVRSISTTADLMLAATFDNGLYLSTDRGDHWSSAVDFGTFYSCCIRDTDLFGGFSDGTYFHSSDNGVNWTRSTEYLGFEIRVFAQNATTLFAGLYDGGIKSSIDNGRTWTQIKNFPSIYSIAVFSDTVLASGKKELTDQLITVLLG